MSVNDGYTKSTAYFQATKLKSFNTKIKDSVTLQTSTVLHGKDGKQFIVPLDDEENEFTALPTRSTIIVDELDKLNIASKENYELDELSNVVEDGDLTTTQQDYAEDHFQTVKIPQNEIDHIISSVNENTSKRQKELLHYHYRLKHLPFSVLKRLAN